MLCEYLLFIKKVKRLMKEIKMIEEKAAKIFFIMKETNNISFPCFVKYWKSKWKEDFIFKNGSNAISKHGKILDKALEKQFIDIYETYSTLWKNKTLKQMGRIVCNVRTHEMMPTFSYKMIIRYGYKVYKAQKCNVSLTNNLLSGFQLKKDGKVVAGKHFDLSLFDVKHIVRERSGNHNGDQTSNGEKSTTGTINI